MIYDTAKELEKLGIDWTAGVQGLQYICVHYPGKCPFYTGIHDDTEMVAWPPLEEMIEKVRVLVPHKPLGLSCNVDGNVVAWLEFDVRFQGKDAREAVAKLLIEISK